MSIEGEWNLPLLPGQSSYINPSSCCSLPPQRLLRQSKGAHGPQPLTSLGPEVPREGRDNRLLELGDMGLFGKSQERPPKDLVTEWSLKIRKEMRVIDRQIRDIQREEEKVKRSVKDAAKKGQRDVCTILAKEIVHSRKAVGKLYASKAQMNSVLMSMKNQLAVAKVTGSLEKSTEVMKAMQSLVKIPEIQATMRDLSKEMMKAGIIEEMLEDTFESMEDEEEMEEAAEMEIDKILFEVTAGALGKAPSKVTDALPEPELEGATAASDEGEAEEDIEEMQSRLAALRS
ncbi:charged multivesicular body protein 3 isoform X2 [Chiloscyllium plagiosum]|nr:charged multivesicular body protein 3 isoform X2 [Chiloscyllium plagiosum]